MTDENTKSIFNDDEFKRYKNAWAVRQKELAYRASYYDGSVYNQKMQDMMFALGPQLKGRIEAIFLPLARAVDIDAGIIPSDWAFPPVQVEPKTKVWQEARDALFDVSKWDTKGVLYVHYGAMYGISGLRVVDMDVDGVKAVILKPVNPRCFMLIFNGIYDQSPSRALWIETQVDDDGKEFEYAEVIDRDKIRTYKNGVLFAFSPMESTYPNTQKRIPLVEVLHIDDGTDTGECTYQKSIIIVNKLNEVATRLFEAIRKNVDPQWVASGAEPSELTRGNDIMWFLPDPNAQVKPVTAQVDIAGTLEFVRDIRAGVHESLPELAFDEIRKAGQIATETVELQLAELVIKVLRARPNYDRGLVEAMKMCGEAASTLSIDALIPLNDPELILDAKRPIIPMSPSEKIALRMSEIELEQMERANNSGEGAPRPSPKTEPKAE